MKIVKIKIAKPNKNYLDHFINTRLNHMSIRSYLVSQSKNKSISNSKQIFDAMHLLPIVFGVILHTNPRGKIQINSQINPATLDENKIVKRHTIKILLDSVASASTARKDVLYE